MARLWNMARAVTLLYCLLPVFAWRCPTFLCLSNKLSLKLWHKGVELNTRYISVKEGGTLTIGCDGSCVGKNDPLLRWYGTDGYWIAHQGQQNRIHTKDTLMKRFKTLVIHNVTRHDAGYYTCRGWLGQDVGFDEKYIRVKVVHPPSPLSSLLTTTTTRRYTTTTTTTTRRHTTTTIPTTTTSQEHDDITEGQCGSTEFRCDNGQCIQHSFYCDTFPECYDESDEANCETHKTCPEGKIRCDDGIGCITTFKMCNGHSDCSDGSDEDTAKCGK